MTEETVTTEAEDVFDVSDGIEDVDLDALEGGSSGGGTILPVTFQMGFQAFVKGASPKDNFVSALTIGQNAASRQVEALHAQGEINGTYTRPQGKQRKPQPQLCLILDGNRILNGDPKTSWGQETGMRYVTLPMYKESSIARNREDYVPRAYQQVKMDAIVPIVEQEGFESQGQIFGKTFWLRLVWVQDPFVIHQIARYIRGDENVWDRWVTYGDILYEYTDSINEPIDPESNSLEDFIVETLTDLADDEEFDGLSAFNYWVPKVLEVYPDQAAAEEGAGDNLVTIEEPFAIPTNWDDSIAGPFNGLFGAVVEALRSEDLEAVNEVTGYMESAGATKEEINTALEQAQARVDKDDIPF